MTIDLDQCVWELPVVVIDFETTSIEDARAVEVACVRFESGVQVAQFSSLVNPGRPIDQGASAVHGIKDSDVSNAPTLERLAPDMFRVCKGAVACAYNAPFDRSILHASISGNDCHAFDPAMSWIDPLALVRHFDRFVAGRGRHKLDTACKRHGVEMHSAHRALSDATACGALLWSFKMRLPGVPARDLIARCDARRAEQEAEYQKYRARNTGGKANGVNDV